MNRARKGEVYQIGRLKRPVNLIKGEEDSSQTRVLGLKSQKISKNNYQKTDFKNNVPHNTAASKERDMSNTFIRNTEQRKLVKC